MSTDNSRGHVGMDSYPRHTVSERRIDISNAQIFFYECAKKRLSNARLNCTEINSFYRYFKVYTDCISLSRPKLWKRDSTTVQPALYSMSVAPCSPTGRWKSEYNINSITITIV